MPLPKRKTSRARKNNRRSHHALKNVQLKNCIGCKEKVKPHTTCQNCNTYNK